MGKKKSILIVDDSLTVRRLVELVLSREGYEVYTAPDGDEGLEIARKVIPSIILVDFVMPRMNGYKLCKLIRSDPKLKDIPLILITSKGEDVGQSFEEKFCVHHYFQKPFEPDELIAKINEVLGVQRGVPAEAPAAAPVETHGELIEGIDKLLRYYFEKEFRVLLKTLMVEVLKETEVARSTGLILSGELGYLTVADVLQFVGMLNLSGRLSVVSTNLNSEIYFERGQIVFSTISKPGYRTFLTDLLVEEKRLKKKDLKSIIAEAKKLNLPVGRVLVQKGSITDDELMGYLKRMTEDAIFHTLAATSGQFYLEEAPLPLNLSDIKFRLSTSATILDGLRKLDEGRLAAEIFRSDDMIPLRLITNEDALDGISLDEKELRVFALIDGKTRLKDIIMKSRLDELEAKRICYSLQKIGLLKIKDDRR
ncbi:MAG TPA: response regulator [Nitrospirae bacterium]|nr:response regulator [Nitrospirota bacterium]